MPKSALFAPLLISIVALACGESPEVGTKLVPPESVPQPEPSHPDADETETPTPESGGAEEALERMRASVKEIWNRDPQPGREIEVQHLLVSFRSAPRMSAERGREEAELLAARLLDRAISGEDFSELVREFTDDSFPGIYPMSQSDGDQMVSGFEQIAWRLAPNEIGVITYHVDASPYGWHIIRRLK